MRVLSRTSNTAACGPADAGGRRPGRRVITQALVGLMVAGVGLPFLATPADAAAGPRSTRSETSIAARPEGKPPKGDDGTTQRRGGQAGLVAPAGTGSAYQYVSVAPPQLPLLTGLPPTVGPVAAYPAPAGLPGATRDRDQSKAAQARKPDATRDRDQSAADYRPTPVQQPVAG